MKTRIKVIYDGSKGIDINLDKKITRLMDSIGAKWYAQGCDCVEPYERDVCFDLEL